MKIFIFVLLLLFGYSLCIIAGDADEQAEKMYRKWREEVDERNRRSDKA